MEILIAKFIPTSQYFEARFDHLQYQIYEMKDSVKNIQFTMDKKFEEVNQKFPQVDKRFDDM